MFPSGVPDGYYRLASAVDNLKGLDIAGASTDNGANAHLWTYGGGSNQKFELKYQNGYYTLMALHSGSTSTLPTAAMLPARTSSSIRATAAMHSNGC